VTGDPVRASGAGQAFRLRTRARAARSVSKKTLGLSPRRGSCWSPSRTRHVPEWRPSWVMLVILYIVILFRVIPAAGCRGTMAAGRTDARPAPWKSIWSAVATCVAFPYTASAVSFTRSELQLGPGTVSRHPLRRRLVQPDRSNSVALCGVLKVRALRFPALAVPRAFRKRFACLAPL